MSVSELFSGEGLRVIDYRCEAGPLTRPFVERHERFSLSYVRAGSFGVRPRGKTHELVAGSFFVGFPGDEYVCTHDHGGGGDECISVHFDDPQAPARAFRQVAIPPLPGLMVMGELLQSAARGAAGLGIEEAALALAGRFARVVSGSGRGHDPRPHERQRAVSAALWMDAHCDEELDLSAVAGQSGLSTF